MSREYTVEEVRTKFLSHIWHLIDYWENESRAPTTRGKLESLAFSIMSALDGCSVELPGFVVAPNPHVSDKLYYQDLGENWFPPLEDEVPSDIGGCLHDQFFQAKECN